MRMQITCFLTEMGDLQSFLNFFKSFFDNNALKTESSDKVP